MYPARIGLHEMMPPLAFVRRKRGITGLGGVGNAALSRSGSLMPGAPDVNEDTGARCGILIPHVRTPYFLRFRYAFRTYPSHRRCPYAGSLVVAPAIAAWSASARSTLSWMRRFVAAMSIAWATLMISNMNL